MTIPSVLFGLVLALLFGTLFHLWKGGGIGRLVLYLLLACAGFWIGHFLGVYLNWHFFSVGPLNTGLATIGSVVFLFLGDWLSRIEIHRS